jgi:dynein heavy chain
MVPGIEPSTALNRLKRFSEEYSVKKRKFDSYYAGETLFGLPHQPYPALEDTRKEIELLDKLYILYSKVKDTIGKWKDVPWVEIQAEISKMQETIEGYARDCQKLPGVLKSWDAYKELKQEIDDMTEILPLVEGLTRTAIVARHWEKIISMTKEDIPYTSETFTLQQLLKAKLLNFRDDIEDITESAEKELKQIEIPLRNEISKYWEDAELEIKMWKGVDTPCILGGNIQDI